MISVIFLSMLSVELYHEKLYWKSEVKINYYLISNIVTKSNLLKKLPNKEYHISQRDFLANCMLDFHSIVKQNEQITRRSLVGIQF